MWECRGGGGGLSSHPAFPTPLFGPVPWPLAVAMKRSSPCTPSALGYQSVGINPSAGKAVASLVEGFGLIVEVSNTATALAEASATNSRFPSPDCAIALG